MNSLNKYWDISSYYMLSAIPKIKKWKFQKRELQKSNSSLTPPLSILFGNHFEWENLIKKNFSGSKHKITFEKFNAENIIQHDLVFPLPLEELRFLNENLTLIKNNPIPVPSIDLIDLCNNKFEFYQIMKQNGFEDLMPKINSRFPYPYILKKKISTAGVNSEIISNKIDEDKYLSLLQSDDYFTQAYIKGRSEYATHILFKNGVIISAITIKHVHSNSNHIQGTYKSKGYVYSTLKRNKFLSTFTLILKAIKFEGFCCIDYKVSNGRLYIFEINPRLGSSATDYLLRFVNNLN